MARQQGLLTVTALRIALQIIRSCQHYEEKCGGQHDSKSLAVRCLYDLSREVQDIVRVLKTTEDAQALRIRELEQVLREWTEIFSDPSPRLQASGVTARNNTPAGVARHVLELSDGLKSNQLESVANRLSMEREISDLRNALRDAQRLSREEMSRELARLKGEADGAIARERAEKAGLAEQLEHVRSHIEQRVDSDTAFRVEEGTKSLRSQVASLEQQLRQADDAAASAARTAELESNRLKSALSKARDELRDTCARHAQSFAEFTAKTGADAAAARQECAALERQLAATIAEWQDRYVSLADRWEHSTAAARLTAVENQVAFYRSRCRELEELCQAMQTALVTAPAISVGVLDELSSYRSTGGSGQGSLGSQGAARAGEAAGRTHGRAGGTLPGEPTAVEPSMEASYRDTLRHARASVDQQAVGPGQAAAAHGRQGYVGAIGAKALPGTVKIAGGAVPGKHGAGGPAAGSPGAKVRQATAHGAPYVRAGAVGPARPLVTAAKVTHAAADVLGQLVGRGVAETSYYKTR